MPLELLEAAKFVDVLALGLTSVLVVALVPEVSFLRLRAGWRRRKSRAALGNLVDQLTTGRVEEFPSLSELKVLKDPVCRFYEAVLDPKRFRDSTLALQRLLKQVDGGRTRLP